jgi:hypothetical protein
MPAVQALLVDRVERRPQAAAAERSPVAVRRVVPPEVAAEQERAPERAARVVALE